MQSFLLYDIFYKEDRVIYNIHSILFSDFDKNNILGVYKLEKLVVKGPTPLKGEVTISGAKNAAVAILPATLLIDGVCTIENLPNI